MSTQLQNSLEEIKKDIEILKHRESALKALNDGIAGNESFTDSERSLIDIELGTCIQKIQEKQHTLTEQTT